MKTVPPIFKTALFTLAVALVASGNLFSQTAPKATWDKVKKVIVLEEKASFGYVFELDIRGMGFTSKAKADAFFSDRTTELVSYQVDFAKAKTTVLLNTRQQVDWRAKEWNAYLATLPKS